MAVIINVHEAKTHLSRLLERVQNGEQIILAKAGRPCARLVPLEEHRPRVAGMARGRLTKAFFEPLPEQELDAWQS